MRTIGSRTLKPEWIGECLGSAGLLFAAVTAVRLVSRGGAFDGVHTLFDGQTLVVGATIATAVVGYGLTPLGRRSGGHVNPAVTLVVWLRQGLSGADAGAYVVAQLAGSIAGVALGRLVWGSAVAGIRYGLIQPEPGLNAAATAAGEFGMTCVLLIVVLAAGRVSRTEGLGAVFSAIVSMIWFGGPWSGASFNPIRNFAPALFSGDYRFQWIYLIAPLLASLAVAAAVHAGARARALAGVHQSQGVANGRTSKKAAASAGE